MTRFSMKMVRVFGLISLFSLTAGMTSFAGQWFRGADQNSDKWWYKNSDGSYVRGKWEWIDGDNNGFAECYYFDKDGWVAQNTTVDGSEVDENGAWVVNGMTQLKTVATSNGSRIQKTKNSEYSTEMLELGSDLDLGSQSDGTSTVENNKDVIHAGADAVYSATLPQKSKRSKSALSESASSGVMNDIKGAVIALTGPESAGISGGSALDKSALVSYARSFVGILPYVTAGSSLKTGADCSGFTQQIYRHFGITIPRDSRSQYAGAEKISENDLQPGDLIFYASGSAPSTIFHVGIYGGDGKIIHDTHSGDYVREHNMNYREIYGFGRYS